MFNKLTLCFSAIVILLLSVSSIAMAGGQGDDGALTIESWRSDDQAFWDEGILPAFNAHYPDIEIQFTPTVATEYNAALEARLAAGTAGDLIAVRAGAVGLNLHNEGHLISVNDVPGLENFDNIARSGWITEDESTVYAIPMASVITGFFYNKDIFEELGLTPPETHAEFFAVLDAIQDDGRYLPLAYGSQDEWTIGSFGFWSVGPSIWGGDAGLNAILSGDKKWSDPEFVEVFQYFKDLIPYMPDNYEAITYADNQSLFGLGQAAIMPNGSWDIAVLEALQTEPFTIGGFAPPRETRTTDPQLYVHIDIGIGANAAGDNIESARKFLEWMTTAEFASLYSNALPGFFSLSDHPVTLDHPAAADFNSWRTREGTISTGTTNPRFSGGRPDVVAEIGRLGVLVLNGEVEPQAAADEVQSGFESWYVPQ